MAITVEENSLIRRSQAVEKSHEPSNLLHLIIVTLTESVVEYGCSLCAPAICKEIILNVMFSRASLFPFCCLLKKFLNTLFCQKELNQTSDKEL